jgi:hypothetical protein
MAEKILALLVAFASGAALVSLIGTKLINLAVRHSPQTRKLIRDMLDREDARHLITKQPLHPMAESFEAGMRAAASEGLCELCIDPINEPYIDEHGTKIWRPCPNPATKQVGDLSTGRVLNVCEEHFLKGVS